MTRLESLLQRGVEALEKLAADPVVQIEAGPPICPFCGTFAPTVKIQEDEGSGPLHLFLIAPTCEGCGEQFYAVPLEWAIFNTLEEASIVVNQRAEIFDGATNGRADQGA